MNSKKAEMEMTSDQSVPSDFPLMDRLETLRRRWRLLALITVTVFLLIVAYTLHQRKLYGSTAKVVVATKKGEGTQLGSILSGVLSMQGGTAETQVEIINSPSILRHAYQQIPLKDRMAGFSPAIYGGYGDPPEWAYEIHSQQDSDIVLINTKSFVPRLAADFANNIANVYLQADRDRNSQATRQGREYVEDQKSRILADLDKAAARFAVFKKKTGIIAPSAQVTDLASNAAKANLALQETKAQVSAAIERSKLLQAQLRAVQPTVDYQRVVAANPEYAQVKAQIVALQGQLAQVSQDYIDGSPERTDIERALAVEEKSLKRLAVSTLQSSSQVRNPILDSLLANYGIAESDKIIANAKASALQSEIQAFTDDFSKFPELERRYGQYELAVQELKETYRLLSTRFYTLLIEERSALADGILVSEGEPAREPDSPKIIRNLFIGVLLGLLFGCIVTLFVDFLDNSFHKIEDVDRFSGVPNLALIPEAKSSDSSTEEIYVESAEPAHAFIEGFRILRNNLTFINPDKPKKVWAITSATKGEGKSTVAANLAIVAALDNQKVLLVDVDLRRPSVHKMMKEENDIGLSNVVMGMVTLEQAIRPTRWQGLSCVTTGPIPPNPTEFLNSSHTRSVLRQLSEGFDVVILDSPPCVGISDMQIIGTIADGVLVVVAISRAEKQALGSALRLLRQGNANIVGTCINRFSRANQGYYSRNNYYSYYGYYATEDETKKAKRKKKTPRSDQ